MESIVNNIQNAKRICIITGPQIGSVDLQDLMFTNSLSKLISSYFATPLGWKMTPGTTWNIYYENLYLTLVDKKPEKGHELIHKLSQFCQSYAKVELITENIDLLQEKLGDETLHIYGSILDNKCQNGHVIDKDPILNMKCGQCQSYVRPDIILFSEVIPEPRMKEVKEALKNADVILVIGSHGRVAPLPTLLMIYENKVFHISKEKKLHGGTWLEGDCVSVLEKLVSELEK